MLRVAIFWGVADDPEIHDARTFVYGEGDTFAFETPDGRQQKFYPGGCYEHVEIEAERDGELLPLADIFSLSSGSKEVA